MCCPPQQVHGHCEPGVRRCALLAAGQVLAALPAPRIAGALLGTSRDPSDAGLVDRLQWIKVSSYLVHLTTQQQACCKSRARKAVGVAIVCSVMYST
jgi:hypothetical protein